MPGSSARTYIGAMRARLFSWLFLGFFALTPALIGSALAQPYGPPVPYGRDGVQPLDRLLPGIRRAHPGDFYDAEGPTYGPSGDPHYHLKWMTPDGRVIWYDTDARSGRVLRSSPGRDSFDNHRFEGSPGYARPYSPGYARPYEGRYPPSMPYSGERGFGRERGFGGGPGYARPNGEFGGRGWGGERGGGGRDWGGRGGGRGRH